jgi:hypothetical protein
MDDNGLAELRWTSHPWAEDTALRRMSLIVSIVAASAGAAFGLESLWMGFISLGLLLVSVSRYLLSTTYFVNKSGVEVRFAGMNRYFPWSRFRRVAKRQDGVFLGTFDAPRRLDAWRGVYVRYPQRRDLIYDVARKYIEVGSPESRT